MTEVREVLIDEKIEYFRHEVHHEPEKVTGNLLSLVYDIPYFGACGIFPPHHIANMRFESGGGDGGMSPGASWEPFRISSQTYKTLAQLVKTTDPKTLSSRSRYTWLGFEFDTSFDHIQDQFQWLDAVCDKHRDRYRQRIRTEQNGV